METPEIGAAQSSAQGDCLLPLRCRIITQRIKFCP